MLKSTGEILEDLFKNIRDGKICPCVWNHRPQRGDSVLEYAFWEALYSSDEQHHGAADQFNIDGYRVDAIIDCHGRPVVIELDGKAYHNVENDARRDARISQHVAAIIRIPYVAMWYYPEAVFSLLGLWYPRLKQECRYNSISLERFNEEYQQAWEDGDGDEFLEDVDGFYQIWSRDLSAVGSPKQFIKTGNFARISHVRTNNNGPGIIDRIWQSTACDRNASAGREVFS